MAGGLLITGATGFVGRALGEELRRRGQPFRASSRATTGPIDGTTAWSEALAGVETIIHLAARVHVMDRRRQQDDATFFPVNVEGTLNLARQARAAGVRRLVFLSSIKVNGETTEGRGPFRADEAPNPQDAYARSKLAAERGLMALEGMETVVVRPPLIYGPGVKANFRRLMDWVARGVPLPLGAVANRRSLISVDNLCDLLLIAAAHPAAAGQVFLASDGHDLSTSELLRSIAEAMGRRARLFDVPPALLRGGARLLGKDAVADRLLGSLTVDISKTRDRLGWTPPHSVEAGLRATVRGGN